MIGVSARNYTLDITKINSDPQYEITELFLNVNELSLYDTTWTEYLDAIAKTEEGKYVNVSEWCEWIPSDTEIIRCDRGRIDALATGSCQLVIKYDDFHMKYLFV